MREDRQVIWVAPSPGGAPSRGDPGLQLHVDLAFVTQSVKIKFKVAVTRWEGKRLKGCVFLPPSLAPVPGARKRNLSIGSISVCLDPLIQKVHRCKVVPDVRSDFAWSHLLAGA